MKNTLIKTKWVKRDSSRLEISDDFVTIFDESPYVVRARGKNETYTFGRYEFFSNFNLLSKCPKEGFDTSIGKMLIYTKEETT